MERINKDHFLLIRNCSDTSEQFENYLKEKEINYNVLYCDNTYNSEKELPLMFSPNSYFVYEGEIGFTLFKIRYQ